MTKKEIYKKLKALAEDIPTEKTIVEIPYRDEHGKDRITENHVMTNHYRRLKHIWNTTKSLEELNNYFKKFNLELKHL